MLGLDNGNDCVMIIFRTKYLQSPTNVVILLMHPFPKFADFPRTYRGFPPMGSSYV